MRRIANIDPGLPIFDCNVADCFVLNLVGNVTGTPVRNISPGALYTFMIIQDEVGGRSFTWPSNCLNPPIVNPEFGSTTTQNFIGVPGGQLIANAPGTWTAQEAT
jgi:hypothetical protein